MKVLDLLQRKATLIPFYQGLLVWTISTKLEKQTNRQTNLEKVKGLKHSPSNKILKIFLNFGEGVYPQAK